MYQLRANVEKNRLYVTFQGFMTLEQIKEAQEVEFQEVEKKLKPGFDLIVDIRDFSPTTEDGAEELIRGQKKLIEMGINRLIRVIGEKMLGKMQLERLAKISSIVAETARSIEEAERMLDKK